MNRIRIFDTTLRDGEQSPGCSMHLSEKLDIAEALEVMRVDVIEAGFPVCSEGDFNAVKEVAKLIKNTTVCALCRSLEKDIERGFEAVRGAVNPMLHLFIATSPIHLQYKLKMTEDEVLSSIEHHIIFARKFTDNIEFSFEDATRTPRGFLLKAAATAIRCGAKTLNIPDTVGYTTPFEIADIIRDLRENADGIENVTLSVHCHNDLGMAVANSLSSVKAGATQIECTVNGIGERAGNCALEEAVMAIKTRKDFFDCETNVDTTKIYRASKLVSGIVGVKLPPNKAIVGANAFAHEAGIHQHGVLQSKATYEIMNPEDIGISQNKLLLGKHSGKHAFLELATEMGYNLTESELSLYFEKFKEVADRKKFVSRQDIEAILTNVNRRMINRRYSLKDYEITSFKGGAWAEVTLTSEGKELTDKMNGDGPVDAAFKTINSLTSKNFVLSDFQIHSVTEGKDALGEAIVKLSLGGESVTGKGVSTDVMEASINAYINAVNKLSDANVESIEAKNLSDGQKNE